LDFEMKFRLINNDKHLTKKDQYINIIDF
jgi:hypothetical protein